ALAAGLACLVLAIRNHTDRLLRRAEQRVLDAEARYQREEAIVSSEPGALYVWQSGGRGEPLTRSGAANLLSGCFDGEEGEALKDAIGSLSAQGSLFSLTVRLSGSEEERGQLADLLDAAPMPVWRRGADLDLIWVNRAYTAAVESAGQDAVHEQIELDRTSRELAERAL